MGTRSQHPPAPLLRVTSLVPPRSGRPSPDTRYFANLRRQKRCLTTMPANDGDTYTQITSRRPLSGASSRWRMGSRWTALSQLWASALRNPSGDAFATKSTNVGVCTGLPAPVSSAGSPDYRPAPSSANLRFPVPSFIARNRKGFPRSMEVGAFCPDPLPNSTSGVSAHPSNRQATDSSLCLATRGVESGEHSAETRRMRA